MLKRIVGLTLAAVLIASTVAGGVWAYYSDIQSSSNNVLLAGTLDLVPSTSGNSTGNCTVSPGRNGVNGNVVFRNMAPGQSGSFTWVMTNAGTINGTLVTYANTIFARGNSSEIKTAAGDNGIDTNGYLDEYVGFTLQSGVGTDNASATANLSYVSGSAGNYTPLSGLLYVVDSLRTPIAASGGNDTVVYKLNWQTGSLFAGVNPNIIQGDTARIDITFQVAQAY